MAQNKIFVGTYLQHDRIAVTIRRTTTQRRNYTHAVIPYYTTRTRFVPSADPHGVSMPIEEPCEGWYGAAQFCGSLARALKKLQPGWILVDVHEYIR